MIRDGCVAEVIDGNVADALKRLKKSVETAGLMKEIRRHCEYTKPGAARRAKSERARTREKRTAKRIAQYGRAA